MKLIKFSSSDTFTKSSSATLATNREPLREPIVWIVSTVVRRTSLLGTHHITLVSAVTQLIPGSVILDEGEEVSIRILMELAISINLQ